MTINETIKNNLKNFEEIVMKDGYYKSMSKPDSKEFIKSSQVSLLLSVKEMVLDNKRNYPMVDEPEWRRGYTEALSDLQAFLDEEINKIKAL